MQGLTHLESMCRHIVSYHTNTSCSWISLHIYMFLSFQIYMPLYFSWVSQYLIRKYDGCTTIHEYAVSMSHVTRMNQLYDTTLGSAVLRAPWIYIFQKHTWVRTYIGTCFMHVYKYRAGRTWIYILSRHIQKYHEYRSVYARDTASAQCTTITIHHTCIHHNIFELIYFCVYEYRYIYIPTHKKELGSGTPRMHCAPKVPSTMYPFMNTSIHGLMNVCMNIRKFIHPHRKRNLHQVHRECPVHHDHHPPQASQHHL